MLKKFFKQFLLLFVISSMIILISSDLAIAENDPPEGIVHYVNSTMNRAEIQTVVNAALNGDTIYFQPGTYDWSDAPIVPRYENKGAIDIFDKTLTIKGEKETIIIGPDSGIVDGVQCGLNAFHVVDEDTNNDVTLDSLSIKNFMRGVCVCNLVVVEPAIDEYTIPNARNVTIKNCSISDTHRQAIIIFDATGNILIQNNDISSNGHGILIAYRGRDFQDWQPDDSCVNIIENNISSGPRYTGIYGERSINFLIKENTINSMYGIGINGAKKGTVISSNYLFNCRFAINVYVWTGELNTEAKETIIEKNKLYGIKGWGIFFDPYASSRHTISKNEINMAPYSFAGIYSEVHDNYYGQNKIKGSGRFAFWLSWTGYFVDSNPIILYAAHHETLHANNVDQFSPDICHFYFDMGTHDNLIIGSGMEYSTYIDNGTNNRITGVTPMAGGIGQELSDAIKKKNEDLKEARKIIF